MYVDKLLPLLISLHGLVCIHRYSRIGVPLPYSYISALPIFSLSLAENAPRHLTVPNHPPQAGAFQPSKRNQLSGRQKPSMNLWK